LARFDPRIAAAARRYRQSHPLIGARRVLLPLASDPALRGLALPDPRTLHRFFVHEGLVARRMPRDKAPSAVPAPPREEPHALWQIDHQDHLALRGLSELTVLQNIRAPGAGLIVGADLFPGPHGAHAVPEDAICDGVRRAMVRWGRPLVIGVDWGVRFLGKPQREFPSRFELFCTGQDAPLRPIRPAHPTDNGAVERQHRTLDALLLGPRYETLADAQRALDEHVEALNTRFPSRAKVCHGNPPLVTCPEARHSGRPYDPSQEWITFNMTAVDHLLAEWRWFRLVGKKTGQLSFAHRNISVGQAHRGEQVALRFDPSDRQVVVSALGPTLAEVGPEITRFHCPAFDKATILGTSQIAFRPTTSAGETPM
jgi:hypothetical protein